MQMNAIESVPIVECPDIEAPLFVDWYIICDHYI